MCFPVRAECKTSQSGKEYKGDLSVTVSGKTCQRWDLQVPYSTIPINPMAFPDETIGDASNYCRNPADLMDGPFCYTSDPSVTWELCNIPFCPGNMPQGVQVSFSALNK